MNAPASPSEPSGTPRVSPDTCRRPLPAEALRKLLGAVPAQSCGSTFRGNLTLRCTVTDMAPDFRSPSLGGTRVTRFPGSLTALIEIDCVIWQHGELFRQELPDGTPKLIRDGHTAWRFHLWPSDTFYRPDPELTAVRVDHPRALLDTLRLPPRSRTHDQLIDGIDPRSLVNPVLYRGTPAWQFTMPIEGIDPSSPAERKHGYTVFVDATNGYLISEWWTMPEWIDGQEWSAVTADVEIPANAFRWAGPERNLEQFRRR